MFLFGILLIALQINTSLANDENDEKLENGLIEDLSELDGADVHTTEEPKPTDPPEPTTPQPIKSTEAPKHGTFSATSLFMGIFFGMLLMFGLTQLYHYWVRSRTENPEYRIY
uniref:Uncharacterized protein n=1 Tax=Acrobeloides nanus TaxID=290746 RepID=A0A914CAP9_9BILA